MSRYLIVSPQCPQPVLRLMQAQGCRIIFSKLQNKIPVPEQFHADLQAFAPDERTLVAAPSVWDYYRLQLRDTGVEVILGNTDSNGHYPATAAYNIARVGATAFGLEQGLDTVVRWELRKRQISFYPVKQGYACCSVVAVDERALVTSDVGIAAAARQAGMDCLLVPPEGILLPGCNHGLIGGCIGLIRPGLYLAAGDVSLYPWGGALTAFFARYRAKLIGVKGKKLFDFGGILSLEGK